MVIDTWNLYLHGNFVPEKCPQLASLLARCQRLETVRTYIVSSSMSRKYPHIGTQMDGWMDGWIDIDRRIEIQADRKIAGQIDRRIRNTRRIQTHVHRHRMSVCMNEHACLQNTEIGQSSPCPYYSSTLLAFSRLGFYTVSILV